MKHLTKREQIAAMAMQGMLANIANEKLDPIKIAQSAVAHTDSLIQTLRNSKPPERDTPAKEKPIHKKVRDNELKRVVRSAEFSTTPLKNLPLPKKPDPKPCTHGALPWEPCEICDNDE